MSIAPPEVKEGLRASAEEPESQDDQESDRRSTRRSFIFLGALAAASAVAPRGLQAQQIIKRKPSIPAAPPDIYPTIIPLAAVSPPVSWSSPIKRLVRRATYGLTSTEIARAQALGYQGWLNRQINYTRINDSMVSTFVGTTYHLLSQTNEQLKALTDSNVLLNQLRESTIYRAAFSERQLYERMVEFWSDHFNIYWDKVGYLKAIDDRDVIRKHAMGRFSDLVMASAKSPAMLAYLDQNLSRVNRTNENYARELMELHTLGVDGGYSQTDVAELARVLTGWTIDTNGRFQFRPQDHDFTAKTVLGISIPATSPSIGAEGIKEGENFINVLVQHPQTARFVSTKMLNWLLTTAPTETQISTIASVFKSTGGDIRLMVRAILNSSWLPAAPAKFKRPFHLLVSGLRAANPTVTAMNTMRSQVDAMGHSTFRWETPDGYPDMIEYWAGNILPRWNFATTLSTQNNATISIDMTPYTGTPTTAVDAINQNYFGGEMSAATRSALISYLSAGTFSARIRETIALAMSSTGFQWY